MKTDFGITSAVILLLLIKLYQISLPANINLDLSLFLPAAIAVVGSFALYLFKQYRQRKRVRTAIRTEVTNMADFAELQSDIQDLEGDQKPPNDDLDKELVPTAESVPTMNYENLSVQLTLLDEHEYQNIVELYTLLAEHKPVLQKIHSESKVPMKNQEDLCEDLGEIIEKKSKVLQMWE